jgi:hypothetical protein
MDKSKTLLLADVLEVISRERGLFGAAAAADMLRQQHDLLGKANALCRIRAAEIERLHAENESLKRTLAASCDEERSQLWEASPGGGCSRALSAEAVNRELLKALKAVCTHAPRSSQQIEADWNKARAAIAKAEGEKT